MKALAAIAILIYAHLWYPIECCHEGGCHPVPCEELSVHDEQLWWHGMGIPYPSDLVRPSPDGQCHFCESPHKVVGYCAYLPKETS